MTDPSPTALHASSIVIDAVCPLVKDDSIYLDWYREGGVTALAPTVSSGSENVRETLNRLAAWDRDRTFDRACGSLALTLMPVAALRLVRTQRYDKRVALGLMFGGVQAVLIAGLMVQSLPLGLLRWLVVLVVTYAAAAMLRSA